MPKGHTSYLNLLNGDIVRLLGFYLIKFPFTADAKLEVFLNAEFWRKKVSLQFPYLRARPDFPSKAQKLYLAEFKKRQSYLCNMPSPEAWHKFSFTQQFSFMEKAAKNCDLDFIIKNLPLLVKQPALTSANVMTILIKLMEKGINKGIVHYITSRFLAADNDFQNVTQQATTEYYQAQEKNRIITQYFRPYSYFTAVYFLGGAARSGEIEKVFRALAESACFSPQETSDALGFALSEACFRNEISMDWLRWGCNTRISLDFIIAIEGGDPNGVDLTLGKMLNPMLEKIKKNQSIRKQYLGYLNSNDEEGLNKFLSTLAKTDKAFLLRWTTSLCDSASAPSSKLKNS